MNRRDSQRHEFGGLAQAQADMTPFSLLLGNPYSPYCGNYPLNAYLLQRDMLKARYGIHIAGHAVRELHDQRAEASAVDHAASVSRHQYKNSRSTALTIEDPETFVSAYKNQIAPFDVLRTQAMAQLITELASPLAEEQKAIHLQSIQSRLDTWTTPPSA